MMEGQKLKIDPNYLLGENLDEHDVRAIRSQSEGMGDSSEEEEGLVERYTDDEQVKNKIESVLKLGRAKTVFEGIEELKKAAEEGKPPLLRQGQIIYGSVSLAHHKATEEETLRGYIENNPLCTSILTFIEDGCPRKYPYLHAAVYAGKHNGEHYVIENGGMVSQVNKVGMISAKPIDKCFEKDAVFFVLSPPKDSRDRSKRYIVLQRALACLGLYFEYHIRAVNCDAFTLALFNVKANKSIQTDVIIPTKAPYKINDKKKIDHANRLKEFHKELHERIGAAPKGNIMTLKYYVEHVNPKNHIDKNSDISATDLNTKYPGWFSQMREDYEAFFLATKE